MKPSIWERDIWYADADLVVVGAGITGLSAALFHRRLHPQGRIVVLERGWLPSGASTRNAGFACFGSVSEILDDFQGASEEEVISRVARRIRGLELLRKEIGDQSLAFDPCGGYEIFTDQSEFERCAEEIPRLNRLLKEAAGLQEAYHVSHINGYPAIACPTEGGIHSGRMMQALQRKATEAGVELMQGAKVACIFKSEEGEGLSVEIEGAGVIHSKGVLVAANGFTTPLLAEGLTEQGSNASLHPVSTSLSVPQIDPARGMILVSHPLEELPWKGIFHYNLGYVYFRHLEGNRLLLGGARDVDKGTEKTPVEGLNPVIREWLLDFSENVLRVPLRQNLDMEWSGTMGFTSQKSPIVGSMSPGYWIAAGLSGIGVSIGMEVGREVAEMIAHTRG